MSQETTSLTAVAATLKFMNTFIANYHRACVTFYIARAEAGNTHTLPYTHTHSPYTRTLSALSLQHLQFSVRISDLATNVTNKVLRSLCVFFFSSLSLLVRLIFVFFFLCPFVAFIRFCAFDSSSPAFFLPLRTQTHKLINQIYAREIILHYNTYYIYSFGVDLCFIIVVWRQLFLNSPKAILKRKITEKIELQAGLFMVELRARRV